MARRHDRSTRCSLVEGGYRVSGNTHTLHAFFMLLGKTLNRTWQGWLHNRGDDDAFEHARLSPIFSVAWLCWWVGLPAVKLGSG